MSDTHDPTDAPDAGASLYRDNATTPADKANQHTEQRAAQEAAAPTTRFLSPEHAMELLEAEAHLSAILHRDIQAPAQAESEGAVTEAPADG